MPGGTYGGPAQQPGAYTAPNMGHQGGRGGVYGGGPTGGGAYAAGPYGGGRGPPVGGRGQQFGYVLVVFVEFSRLGGAMDAIRSHYFL